MVGGFLGWVGGRVCGSGWWVMGEWVGGWWWEGHGVGGGEVDGGGGLIVVVMLWIPMTPPSWGASDAPMLFFDNLVKKLDQSVKK